MVEFDLYIIHEALDDSRYMHFIYWTFLLLTHLFLKMCLLSLDPIFTCLHNFRFRVFKKQMNSVFKGLLDV